ncbi:Uncharacterized protein TCM_038888 [Theobroma cacao]|uniref:Uncharacterized protein n=1 Tax=Theobroma cacao TaxID=3641 RepID=A0A061GXD8_THECC|nr:Uncharacterized protein TCM_038888 [Theobroma cacao]
MILLCFLEFLSHWGLVLLMSNVKLKITYGGHGVDDTYKSVRYTHKVSANVVCTIMICASNQKLRSCQQMQSSLENALGPLPFAKDIVTVVSDDDASDQMDDDYVEDDIADWNDDDYVSGMMIVQRRIGVTIMTF